MINTKFKRFFELRHSLIEGMNLGKGALGVNETVMAEKIHRAALDLLMDPGIKLDHDEICKTLLDAGAKEGTAANVIRFPKELVEENGVYQQFNSEALPWTKKYAGKLAEFGASL